MTQYGNYKDFYFRNKLKKLQKNKLTLKFFLSNSIIDKKIRFKIMLKYQQLYKKNISQNKIKNRCMISTKVRSVSRLSNMTKATLKKNIQ
jgi:lysine/ornithine N-monooxygenase